MGGSMGTGSRHDGVAVPGGGPADLTEDIGGYRVSDPYRWLEDAAGDERAGWLAAQADLFGSYREELPGRDRLAAQVRELLGTGHVGTPAWRGERYFFTRRDPGAEHGALYLQAGDGPADVLIDPMAIDPSGLTTLDAWQPDKEGRLLAYQLSEGGDEESLLRVMDVTTGAVADGPIDRCRYSNVAWLPGGKAFYYTRGCRRMPCRTARASTTGGFTCTRSAPPPDEDTLIFGEGREKTELLRRLGQPGRPVAVHQRLPGHRTAQRPLDRRPVRVRPRAPDLRVIQEGVDAQTGVRAGRDGRLYVFTDLDAPRGRIA